MKPLFTIHAGEYLVGTEIEKRYPNCEVWLPSKDTGIDLLVTNKNNRKKNIGIQVKFSKDFLPEMKNIFHDNLLACGWWALNAEKILKSKADIWILAPYSFRAKEVKLIIINPKLLINKLKLIHGNKKIINTYLWVTNKNKCFETRDLSKEKRILIEEGKKPKGIGERDFSSHLNNWDMINKRIL